MRRCALSLCEARPPSSGYFGVLEEISRVAIPSGVADTKAFDSFNLLAFFLVLFTGCANTCFVAVSSPPNGTIGIVAGNPPPACPPATAKGAVRLAARTNHVCEFCSESDRVQSVLLSLRGIDIHLRENAGDASSHWIELLPQREERPGHVVLPMESRNSHLADPIIEGVPIPVGTYDLVRLRLGSNPDGSTGEESAGNICGRLGPHCLVMADGQIEPLVFDTDAMESRFNSETRADGLFFVLPGSDSELLIELTPVVSIGVSFGKGPHFFSLLLNRTTVERLPPIE